jgi:hypothetical protein
VTVQSVVCINGGGDSHGPIVTRGSVKCVAVGSLKPVQTNNPTPSVGGNIASCKFDGKAGGTGNSSTQVNEASVNIDTGGRFHQVEVRFSQVEVPEITTAAHLRVARACELHVNFREPLRAGNLLATVGSDCVLTPC